MTDAPLRVASRQAAFDLAAAAIAAPLLIFPNRFSVVALILLPAVWLLRLVVSGRLRRSGSEWPLAGLLLMTLVSLYPSVDLALSQAKLFGLILGYFVFALALEQLDRASRFAGLAVALVAGGVAVAIAGLVGTNWIQSKISLLGPLYAALPHLVTSVRTSSDIVTAGFQPNEVAGTLDLLIPVAIGLALFGRPPAALAAASAACLMGGTLLLTASRSGMAGLLIGLAAICLLRWRRAALAIPAILVGIVVAVAFIGPSRVLGWLLAMQASPGIEGSAATRLEIWNRAWLMVQDFPFTGIGLNTFSVVTNLMYPLFLSGPNPSVPHAHDLYLQTALDLGIPGLLFFLVIVFMAGRGLHRAWRYVDGWQRGLVAGMTGGLAAYLTFSLTDAVTLGAKPGVFLWAILGGSVALGFLPDRSDQVRLPPAGWLHWMIWSLFSVACGAGLLIQLTGIRQLPL